jgi:hypothetical protein
MAKNRERHLSKRTDIYTEKNMKQAHSSAALKYRKLLDVE